MVFWINWLSSFLAASLSCPTRAPAEKAGGDGSAAGQPADGYEDELWQWRPDARPGAGRWPDRPVAPGRHTGPGWSQLCPPWELQPAQHWQPGYFLRHLHSMLWSDMKSSFGFVWQGTKTKLAFSVLTHYSYSSLFLFPSLCSWASGLTSQSWPRCSYTPRLVLLFKRVSEYFSKCFWYQLGSICSLQIVCCCIATNPKNVCMCKAGSWLKVPDEGRRPPA